MCLNKHNSFSIFRSRVSKTYTDRSLFEVCFYKWFYVLTCHICENKAIKLECSVPASAKFKIRGTVLDIYLYLKALYAVVSIVSL